METKQELEALTGLERGELEAWVEESGEKRYRAGQILEWVYYKRVGELGDMTNLGKGFRERMGESFSLRTAEVLE
ncbi:MAG: 23S rRNA (adenine(2503)-C(2))-methyltransferase RlmN, partial [Verrucomicrobiota bacterium]